MSSDHLPGSNLQVNECSNLKSPDFGFCYPVCTFKLYHKASPITTITGLSLREQGTMISFPGFLSYYCPEKEMATHVGNPMDRGAWWVHGVAKSDMTEKTKTKQLHRCCHGKEY